jgi:CubicO group peptidase (beta-lactamase class C family)
MDAPNSSVDGTCSPEFEAVRDTFTANFADGDLGASCAVTLRGNLVVDLWGGHRDIARCEPWQRDTIVNIWSTTKMISAMSVLMLHDRGKLDVDAPMAMYWPEFAANGKDGVLVRHVLGHTAGLATFDDPPDDIALFDWDACCKTLAEQAPSWTPGDGSGYHAETQGWLLGELVRRVDGRSLGHFFREEVAEPLSLDLHLGVTERDFPRIADVSTLEAEPNISPDPSLHERGQKSSRRSASLVNTRAWRQAEFPSSNAHGNARSVALAMAPFANGGLARGITFLSPATIERAFEQQADGIDRTTGHHFRLGMGFGLNSPKTPLGTNDRTLWWAGWGGSMTVIDVQNEMTVSYTMNRMRSAGDARAIKVIYAAHGCRAKLD